MTPNASVALLAACEISVIGCRFSDDIGTQTRVLAKLREHALEGAEEIPALGAVFDDLEAVLGERTDLTAGDVRVLTPRLLAAFRRALSMSQRAKLGIPADVIKQAQHLLVEQVPTASLPARGYLRRLASVTADLLDALLEDTQ